MCNNSHYHKRETGVYTAGFRVVQVRSGELPANDPGQGLGADVQSFSDIRVVQVEGGGGGVGAGGVQTDRQVERRQAS